MYEADITAVSVCVRELTLLIHDLREYVRAENCSISTWMKLDSFAHDIQRERMERPFTAPVFARKTDKLRKLQTQLQTKLHTS